MVSTQNQLGAAPPLWRNVSFHLLWSSTFFSGVGDRLMMLGAYDLLGIDLKDDNSASVIAAVDFFFFLPYLLWSPLAGWLADRLPRKWVMFAADEIRGLLMLGTYLAVVTGVHQTSSEGSAVMVYALILAIGVMAATFVPAKLSIIPSVVGLEHIQRANAMVVSMGVIGNLTGFIVGGHFQPSVEVMLIISAAAYAGSGVFWVFLRTPWHRAAAHQAVTFVGVFRDIRDGMVYARAHRPILILIAIAALIWTGTSVLQPALEVVNKELYGNPPGGFEFTMACLGGGMLVGALLVGVINPRRGGELLIACGLFGCGVLFGLTVVVPSQPIGLALSFGIGFFASVLLVPLNTMIQQMSADRIRGRVFAAKEILTEFGKVVVAFIIWQIHDANSRMRPIAIVMAILYIGLSVWGGRRHLIRGPLADGVLNFIWRVCRLYAYGYHRLQATGAWRVPHEGAVLMVSNHTAGVDPVLIQAPVPRTVKWVMLRSYMASWLNFLWSRIKPIPVDRQQTDSSAARATVQALKDGHLVGLFPEGHINPNRGGLAEFRPGVSLIARRAGAVIVPVWIEGTPRVESAWLSLLIPSRSRVVYGEPVRPEDLLGEAGRSLSGSERDALFVERLRERILALRPNPEAPSEGAAQPA